MRLRTMALIGLGTVAILELGLRFGVGLGDPPLVTTHPDIEYTLVPSATYTRFGNRIDVNAFGMRSPAHTGDALPQERRILLIGDSVIYGNHFLDQSETIATQMTQRLKALPELAECQPLTMAAAASSWGPVNQAAFVAQTGTLAADVAILVVSAHDLYDTPNETSDTRSLIPYRLRPSFGALDDALQIAYERLRRRLVSHPADAPAALRQARTLEALERLHQHLRQDGVPFLLVYHPIIPERKTGMRAAHTIFESWARAAEVPFVTLTQPDLAAPGMYRDHIHPAAPGAAAIAGHLVAQSMDYLRPCDA